MDSQVVALMDEKTALQDDQLKITAELKEKEEHIVQSEMKFKALEDQFKLELAAKEAKIQFLTTRNSELQVRHLSRSFCFGIMNFCTITDCI